MRISRAANVCIRAGMMRPRALSPASRRSWICSRGGGNSMVIAVLRQLHEATQKWTPVRRTNLDQTGMGSRPGGPGLMFVIEGAFAERGGKEISLALIGKAHLVRLIAQSFVVIFKNGR